MGYKLLGFAVWKAARWYLRRQLAARRTKALAAGAALAVAAGAVAVLRRRAGTAD